MIKSYCKINLFLKILKKNNTGLHDIQSATMLLNFYDNIHVEIIKKKIDEVKFIGFFKKNINIKKKYSN